MPATRSRTLHWRSSLQSIHERGGALEVSPAARPGQDADDAPTNLIFRVRILRLTDSEIVVEEPMALGRSMPVDNGAQVIGVIVIGQNRWMFRTTVLGATVVRAPGGRETTGLRLAMPDTVERCQRRHFYRVQTEHLRLPPVDCYPLLDPASAAVAEQANELEIRRAADAQICTPSGTDVDESDLRLPDVGPKIGATLVNIGGGGAGLKVEPGDRSAFDSHRLFWLRVNLAPLIAAPLGVAGRVRHTHIDSTQALYAGVSFEFGHNPEHASFVAEQLSRYVALMQRETGDGA